MKFFDDGRGKENKTWFCETIVLKDHDFSHNDANDDADDDANNDDTIDDDDDAYDAHNDDGVVRSDAIAAADILFCHKDTVFHSPLASHVSDSMNTDQMSNLVSQDVK